MSTFGKILRVTTFGESHGDSVGAIIDGFPSRTSFPLRVIQDALNRRRPGQSSITTQRNEKDKVFVVSGVQVSQNLNPSAEPTTDVIYDTLGSPICMFVHNEDQRPSDYNPVVRYTNASNINPKSNTEPDLSDTMPSNQVPFIPRPSHADLTWYYKFGIMAKSGGGRASGRETIGRVAAGALAAYWLKRCYDVDIVAFVSAIGSKELQPSIYEPYVFSSSTKEEGKKNFLRFIDSIHSSIVRCPCPVTSQAMVDLLSETKRNGDSIGSQVTCIIHNCPTGLGEPVFDKLSAILAQAMLSIPAAKGILFGEGLDVVKLNGSQHNDPILRLSTHEQHGDSLKLQNNQSFFEMSKNYNAGLQGGISNGYPIYFHVPFKPPSSISKTQHSVSLDGDPVEFQFENGRHDPCIGPRAASVVEAMAALTIMDALLMQKRNSGTY